MPTTTTIDLSAPERTILLFLSLQSDDRGTIYGNIAQNTGIARTNVEELCPRLYASGLAAFENDRVFITEAGKEWAENYIEQRDDRIREYVYKDYEFALLRFVIEQDPPLAVDDFPEVLKEEAPSVTTGSDTFNLMHHLEIIWQKYFESPKNKYVITPAGRKRYEYLLKEKGISLNDNKPKSDSKESDFTATDIQEMNVKIDQLKEMISAEFEKVQMSHEFTYNDIIEEFEEMRRYYNLPKKTWRQLFTGKLAEMTVSGVVSETISKEIVEFINPGIGKLLE